MDKMLIITNIQVKFLSNSDILQKDRVEKCNILGKLQFIKIELIPIEKKWSQSELFQDWILQKYSISFWVIDMQYKIYIWSNHFKAKQNYNTLQLYRILLGISLISIGIGFFNSSLISLFCLIPCWYMIFQKYYEGCLAVLDCIYR